MSEKRLRVPHVPQYQSMWCWAAAAEMVLRYYSGQNATQCSLANDLFNRNDCCQNNVPDACNHDADVRDIGRIYDEWQVNRTLHPGPIQFSRLKDEIENERPVEVAYEWAGGGKHVVIVRGYREDQDGQFVVLNDPDPWREISDQPLQDFKTAEGRGSWWRTWTGITT